MPSQENIEFTENALDKTSNLTDKDLVLVVISFGIEYMGHKVWMDGG